MLRTPPPSPSSPYVISDEPGTSKERADDDDTAPSQIVEYPSEQHELIALIENSTGQAPDGKLLVEIADKLKLRAMSLRAYLDDLRPRLRRLRRKPGPGFFFAMAAEPSRSTPATADPRPASPERCADCRGAGKTPGGKYCECVMGRDLALVEKPSARKPKIPEAAA